MSLFDFFHGWGSSKPVTITVPPQPEHLRPTPTIKTYAFAFKFFVNYTNNEDKQSTYNWTSDLYLDYNSALKASRDIIKDICHTVNSATFESEPVFIIDIALKKEDFISATASDPILLEFSNGVLEKAIDINVFDGGNAIIEKLPTGDKLNGNYKTMKLRTDF